MLTVPTDHMAIDFSGTPMRRAAAFAFCLSLASTGSARAEHLMTVQIDHSERVSLPGVAANVFVGNASIADAVIVDRRNLVVVGRGYGVTNLLVLDAAGRTILNREIQVSPGDAGRMTHFAGGTTQNFTCSPTCERTPMPGEPDSGGPFGRYNSPYGAYQDRASSGSGQDTGGGGGDSDSAGGVAAAAAAGAAAGAAAAAR